MFNGSQYVVSLWAKLAPGQADTQLRVSLDRKLGTATETFHQVVGNTTVTANAWVRLQATYNQALANSLADALRRVGQRDPVVLHRRLQHHLRPAGRSPRRNIPSVFQSVAAFFPIVGAAVIPADIQQSEPAVLLSKHFNSITSGNDMKWDATEADRGELHLHAGRRRGRLRPGQQHARPWAHAGLAQPDAGLGLQPHRRHPADEVAGRPGAADPAPAEPHQDA